MSEMPILTLKDGVITSVTVLGKNGADPEDITEIVKKNANEDGSFHAVLMSVKYIAVMLATGLVCQSDGETAIACLVETVSGFQVSVSSVCV